MEPYFVWKGIDSRTMDIVVNEYPNPAKPEDRVKEITVPGRAGTLTMLEGENVFENIVLTCLCTVLPAANIETLGAWLRGAGTVCFGNDENRCYKARLDSQLSFERLVAVQPFREAAIPFVCQPFKYLVSPGADIVKTVSGQKESNPGTVASLPKITVKGSGDITLVIATQAVTLTDIVDGIVIDSEMMDAYNLEATELLNENMVGDFPRIPPGEFAISWIGDVSKVTVVPRWRWL